MVVGADLVNTRAVREDTKAEWRRKEGLLWVSEYYSLLYGNIEAYMKTK